MKNKDLKLFLIILILVLLVVALLYCFLKNDTKISNKENLQTTIENVETSYKSSETSNEIGEYTAKITLNDDKINATGTGVTINNNIITITKTGTYYVTGTTADASIRVDCSQDGDVQIVLDNANITSKTTAPINGIKADNLIITLAENSVNYLTDSENYIDFTDTEKQEPDGTLFTKTDLVINGSGKLVIDSNYQDGIVSKDSLKIINAEIEITSADDGIRGKDYVAINNANITIEATKKGIRSTNTEDSSLGYVIIDSGTININKSYEGIEARLIKINGGTVNIMASDDGINASDGSTKEGMMRKNNMMGQSQNDSNVAIIINGGEIYINASGDGIDSNGSVYINGGKTVVAGPTSEGDSSLDYDGTCVMTGGELICYGSIGMWQSISNDSSVCELVFYNSGNTGDKITIKDGSGNEIESFETSKQYSGIGFASSKIENGKSYTLYVNGEEKTTITANDTVTSNGNNKMENRNPRNLTRGEEKEPKNFKQIP